MAIRHIDKLTSAEVESLPGDKLVAVLPLGSLEAHGPHLPVSTDTIIASKMAELAGNKISGRGFNVIILPPLPFAPTSFAKSFKGTLDLESGLFESLFRVMADWSAGLGVKYLVIANCHFDPAHMTALRNAVAGVASPRVVFPDFTVRRLAQQLTDEFKAGSCHAGQFETSLVLAAGENLVRAQYKTLKSNAVNLVEKMRSGATDFKQIGMERAYCGDPAGASKEEGIRIYEIISDIIVGVFVEEYEKASK